MIMSPDGYILTNYHVINNADQILVILTDGRRFFDVQLIGFDTITDLALLKINANHLPVIPVNDNYTTNVGDLVLAIGNPLNLGQTITQGIISATGKQKITDSPYNNLLQMDAAINVGNSGGALVNSNGDLVGITSAQFKTRENLNIQGIFFAVPYTLAKEVMGKLIRHGRVVRGYLGFEGTAVDSSIVATSRWLVGSSKSRTSGSHTSARASAALRCQPPDKSVSFVSAVSLSAANTLLTRSSKRHAFA